jgi:transcriptional regulator GlxA family with amidase domain
MHRITVIAVPPVNVFDLSIPEMLFGNTTVDSTPAYRVTVCTADPGWVRTTGTMQMKVDRGLRAVAAADTVIVTGTGARDHIDVRVLDALRRAAAAGKRIASICTGAFVLAEAGLLEGRSATTYWVYSDEFRQRYPGVQLRPDVLYVDDGSVLTSAGVAAGIDLCIHIIRRDLGAKVANTAARMAVVAPLRPGGQAQFVKTPVSVEGADTLARTRAWALNRLAETLTLNELAAHARMSVRTLTRRFKAETNYTPLQWLLAQRVNLARELLESTPLSIEQVAARCGLGGSDSLRKHMRNQLGLTPSGYRNTFSRITHQ